jgi:hypothetical protein
MMHVMIVPQFSGFCKYLLRDHIGPAKISILYNKQKGPAKASPRYDAIT